MSDSSIRVFYSLGIIQFIAMASVIFIYPPLVTVVLCFTPSNGFNASNPSGNTHTYSPEMGMPSLVVSLATLIFVTVTLRMLSETSGDSMQYTEENVSSTGHWDALFWGVVLGIHAIFVVAVCSPVDFYAALVATYTMVRALVTICKPLSNDPTSMAANTALVGFVAGLAVALVNTPPQYPTRYVLLCILASLDYVLVAGHCWDRNPSILTIANCRLCWVISSTFFIAALQGNFHDKWLMD